MRGANKTVVYKGMPKKQQNQREFTVIVGANYLFLAYRW